MPSSIGKKITVHVFDNLGVYLGTVKRSNFRPLYRAMMRRGTASGPLVDIRGIRRDCIDLSGLGWAVYLMPKGQPPRDLKPAGLARPTRHRVVPC